MLMYGGDHARKFGNPHGQHGGFVQPAELEAKAAEEARVKAAAALRPFAADIRRLCGGNIDYENHRSSKARLLRRCSLKTSTSHLEASCEDLSVVGVQGC